MAKSILVETANGTKYLNQVTHLVTDLQSGGTCTWIPLDEIQNNSLLTVTLYNGVYQAVITGAVNGDIIAY